VPVFQFWVAMLDAERWRMEDGRWRMEDGGWRMEDGGSFFVYIFVA